MPRAKPKDKEPTLASAVGPALARALARVDVKTLHDLRAYGWRPTLKMLGERDPKHLTRVTAYKLLAAAAGKKTEELTPSQLDDAGAAAQLLLLERRAKRRGTSIEDELDAETERQNRELHAMVEASGLGDFYRAVAQGVDPMEAALAIPDPTAKRSKKERR
jgi:hypothetical protein